MKNCKANCRRDGREIRFLENDKLVWEYYWDHKFDTAWRSPQTWHQTPMKKREFTDCPCGCGNLISDPAPNVKAINRRADARRGSTAASDQTTNSPHRSGHA